MKPIYAENIVVAIKQNNCIEWYILDKDYCFLDYSKLEDAYRRKGYDVVIDMLPPSRTRKYKNPTWGCFYVKKK